MAISKSYFDYSFLGELETTGAIREYIGSEAVANAVRAWLASFHGEVLRKPTLGGNLVNLLLKPLSEDRALLIRDRLVIGLKTEFTPRVLVTSVIVTPVYEGEYYNIRIIGYCPSVKDNIDIDESINRLLI